MTINKIYCDYWRFGIVVIIIFYGGLTISATAEVSYKGHLAKNFKNAIKLRNKIQDRGTKVNEGTTRDRIDETQETHKDNLVFFHKESKEKHKNQPSILLKSKPSNASNIVPSVGDGLDLARASILLRKSSPNIVTTCVGNQVTLKCAAEGNPAPEFTWYKGKQVVAREKVTEYDLKIAPSLFTRASTLTLTPNEEDDFGEYQCAASNTLGATQQSTHRIVLTDNGESVCAQSAFNKDKKKFNTVIIGTISLVGMLLILLGIAGFVFWKLNKQDADSYQLLKTRSASTETMTDGCEASTSENTDNEALEMIQDDFNAKEIGRLSSLLSADWERLARLLGFHQHDINAIRDDSDKIESRCASMLHRFRRRRGSRETLAESVEEMKDIETANAIRQKYYKSNPTE